MCPSFSLLTLKALRFKTLILVEIGEDAIPLYNETIKRLKGAKNPEMADDVAAAINIIAFQILREAKRIWREGNEPLARQHLAKAQKMLATASDLKPQTATLLYILGNIGYIHFLSDERQAAKKALTKAINLGGEKLQQAEMKDSRIHPLPLDKEFRALIHSIPIPPTDGNR